MGGIHREECGALNAIPKRQGGKNVLLRYFRPLTSFPLVPQPLKVFVGGRLVLVVSVLLYPRLERRKVSFENRPEQSFECAEVRHSTLSCV